jgi:MoxR-like ATPase
VTALEQPDCPDHQPMTPVAEALTHLDAALTDLDEQQPRALEAGHSAARLLAAVDGYYDRLGKLRAELARAVAADLKPRERAYDVDGVTLRVSGGSRRVWTDSRQLAWRVIEPALVDEESGEVRAEEPAAWHLLDRLLQALPASPSWRVRELQALDVEYDDLTERRDAHKTVSIVAGVPS